MQIPRPIFHLLVATITQFVLVVVALTVLVPTGLLTELPWSMIGFLLAYNIVVATLVAIILTNNNSENQHAVVKGGGLVLGHLVGVLLGGFVGLKYGGAVGAIAGATLLYFVAGWIGSHISATIGAYLDALNRPAEARDLQSALRVARSKNSSLFVYAMLIPALFLAAAVFMRSLGLPVGPYPWILPTARTVLVILSLVSMLIPWLRRGQPAAQQRTPLPLASGPSAISLVLSLAPAAYGFLLFVAFGMSFAELSIFAIVASIATTSWAVRSPGS